MGMARSHSLEPAGWVLRSASIFLKIFRIFLQCMVVALHRQEHQNILMLQHKSYYCRLSFLHMREWSPLC